MLFPGIEWLDETIRAKLFEAPPKRSGYEQVGKGTQRRFRVYEGVKLKEALGDLPAGVVLVELGINEFDTSEIYFVLANKPRSYRRLNKSIVARCFEE